MRKLSPRDIKLTSPRVLTPGMAAKVANSKTQFPSVPAARLRPNMPIPPTSTRYAPASSPLVQEHIEPPAAQQWPSVAYAELNSPVMQSPASRSVSDSAERSLPNVSDETLKRGQTSDRPSASEWKPRRPNRPPSPNLGHVRTLSHSLDPVLVNQLRSPGSPSHAPHVSVPNSPAEGAGVDGDKRGSHRSKGSTSLKNLKQKSNISVIWGRDSHDTNSNSGANGQPFVPSRPDSRPSFTGLRGTPASPSSGEFGVIRPPGVPGQVGAASASASQTQPQPQSQSLPRSSGLATRILNGTFPFRREKTKEPVVGYSKRTPPITSIPLPYDLGAGAGTGGAQRQASSSGVREGVYRHPSQPQSQSQSNDQRQSNTQRQGQLTTPTSPHSAQFDLYEDATSSPGKVKRKPVPGMEGGGMQPGPGQVDGPAEGTVMTVGPAATTPPRGFTLEDPPKRRNVSRQTSGLAI
jgi:hypothetical protein